MAKVLFRCFRRASSSLLKPPSSLNSLTLRPIFGAKKPASSLWGYPISSNRQNPSWGFRELSHGTVNLVISDGKLKFEAHEVDPPKKYKWMTKKRLKMQRKREKEKRKAANRKDPRKLTVKRKRKQKFANAAERIKSKLERAKIKEALLIERLKKYEVPKVQGPEVQPHTLTGEERFFLKKMAQKKLNYVPVGRRGIFGGVILNMHMHWKKHETVKVICKPCKPGQVHEYAQEIARLSGGIPIQIVGDHTIIFYRGKNYVQPEVMSPIDTLSKKRALEKSKYEQSLESVRHFIAIAEKELELYYRHIALYGDPDNRNPISILDGPTKDSVESRKPKSDSNNSPYNDISSEMEMKVDSPYRELSEESENDFVDESLWESESEPEDDILFDRDGEESEESSSSTMFDSLTFDSKFNTQFRDSRREPNKSLV